jgi:hypothetical protein
MQTTEHLRAKFYIHFQISVHISANFRKPKTGSARCHPGHHADRRTHVTIAPAWSQTRFIHATQRPSRPLFIVLLRSLFPVTY